MRSGDFIDRQKRLGMNGRQLADALGKTTETISNYRTKGVPPRETKIVALALTALEAAALAEKREAGTDRPDLMAGVAEAMRAAKVDGLTDVVIVGVRDGEQITRTTMDPTVTQFVLATAMARITHRGLA